jgi:hypothetical protein
VERTGARAGEAEFDALLRRAGRIAGRRGALALVVLRLACGRPEDRDAREHAWALLAIDEE